MGFILADSDFRIARTVALRSMRRLTRADWLALGLQIIATAGPGALTIERLCEKANRTRGSFYHHFHDHQGYLEALVDEWHRIFVKRPIAESRKGAPQEKLRRLNQLASELDPRVEIGVRRLAASNSGVRSKVSLVDAERLRYLASLYREAGLTQRVADKIARLEYAAYVGSQVLWPDARQAQSERLGRFPGQLVASYYQPR